MGSAGFVARVVRPANALRMSSFLKTAYSGRPKGLRYCTLLAACLAIGAGTVSAQPPATPPATQRPAAPPNSQTPPSRPPTALTGQTPAQNQAARQPAENPTTVCGLPIPQPARLPPAGSGPVVYLVVPCFQKQGGFSTIESNTYLYYMEMSHNVSRPSENKWVPYDDKAEQTAVADFKRLWATNFLDDLSIDVKDYRFSNGVIGKMIVYDMEERQRVKIVEACQPKT